jgi:PIN domain nuclease of toxin-antitoxin system
LRILLDTHALVWMLNDNPRLSARARSVGQDEQIELLVSAVSAMEIFTKFRLGKLPEAGPIIEYWDSAMAPPGFIPVAITMEHARLAGSLPIDHKDPFDRLLIAQAIVEGVPLLSNEKIFDDFGVERIW